MSFEIYMIVQATAGLRLLDGNSSELILEAVIIYI